MWLSKNKEKKTLGIYFKAVSKLIDNTKYEEDTMEGLVMQLALLEKIRDVMNSTIEKLKGNIEKVVQKELN